MTKHDSARHLQRFEDTMARHVGEIGRLIDSAKIHCFEKNGDSGECVKGCPWANSNGERPCKLYAIENLLGDHVKQDDVTEER